MSLCSVVLCEYLPQEFPFGGIIKGYGIVLFVLDVDYCSHSDIKCPGQSKCTRLGPADYQCVCEPPLVFNKQHRCDIAPKKEVQQTLKPDSAKDNQKAKPVAFGIQKAKTVNENVASDNQKAKTVNDSVASDNQKAKTVNENVASDNQKAKTVNDNVASDNQKAKTVNENVASDNQKAKTVNDNVASDNQKAKTDKDKVPPEMLKMQQSIKKS